MLYHSRRFYNLHIMLSYNQKAFFELVRAGLFPIVEVEMVNDSLFMDVDWSKVYQLAQEQSVQGLTLQGIERLKTHNLNYNANDGINNSMPQANIIIPQKLLLQWVGEMQIIEQRNKAMNQFIADLILKMREAGIYTLMVKGQEIAQCYEKPLWRACGDVDLLLSHDEYDKAKAFLQPLARTVETEGVYQKHLGLIIDSWVVELHGSLRTGLSSKVDCMIDGTQETIFHGGQVRSWKNGKVQVFLPNADNDLVFIFTHFLKHFYKGGLGLRQICDWCRLLWTFRDSLDYELLETRIQKMGLMTEWKAFGAFAVDYLGMPSVAMPFYSNDKKWSRKGNKICAFVIEVGNFGHNRDNSYYAKYPFLIRKIYSFGRRCGDLFRHARIFPLDSLRFFPYMMYNGLKAALNGVRNN